MSRFSYIAIQSSGKRVTGELRGRSRREVLRELLGRGVHPVSLKALSGEASLSARLRRALRGRVSVGHLAVFTRQLSALLKAGMPVIQALGTLRQQSESKRLISVIGEVEDVLQREGSRLADALGEHPRVFSGVYRSLVRSGEEGGSLTDVLDNLAAYLSRSARLKGQVIGAFIYPIFLLVLGMTAIFVLTTFVIPQFEELFDSFGGALPGPTRLLIDFSAFMSSWWWAILTGLAGAILLTAALLRRPRVAVKFDAIKLRLPIVGKMLLKLEVSRISRTLSALVGGGVGMLAALKITGRTARNRAIRETFEPIIGRVADGDSVALAVERAKVYPPLMVNLIRTGEDTGRLPDMLNELSEIYQEEAQRAVTSAVKLLEPVLIIVLGGIIAAIVAAVMLPIFEANAMIR